MEELNVGALPSRIESVVPLTGKRGGDVYPLTHSIHYPLALVLRLRVLQIVCGISTMVMGSVAFIEERHKFNMGLGIPAGALCVLAAAVSIHTTKGMSTLKRGAAGTGVAFGIWIVAWLLLLSLFVLCARTINAPDLEIYDDFLDENTSPSTRDLIIIASVQIILTITSLFSAAICVWIEHFSLG